MKKIFKLNIILVLGLLIGVVSCTKNFEEMNINPNEPSDAPSTNILVHSLRYVGDAFYDDWQGMNNFLSYGGQVTKIQYVDEARYEYRESVVNNAWRDYYNTLMDLDVIIRKCDAEETFNMKAAAMTLKYMLFQMATDQWKAIPYSQALKGEEGTTNPAYDDQPAIYTGIIDGLKQAADIFASGAGDDDLGGGDILYYGDIGKWQRFCNSLRLRVAMRISNVDEGTAKAIIGELMANPTGYPMMGSNDDNAFMFWPGVSPDKEPWQENSETRDDHGMCNVLVDWMKTYNDPRLPVYAYPGYVDEATGEDVYTGNFPGAMDGTFRMDTISRIGYRFRDDAAGFTPFMRYSEVLFFLAEAAQRWGNVGQSAEDLYKAGIQASMEENGIDQAAIDAYYAQDGVAWAGDIKQIHAQKWCSIFKEGQEVWAEARRTDYPAIDQSPGSPYSGHNRQPFRYPYPVNEFNLNNANLSQKTGGIVDHFWGQQMWWDTRTGVQ
jgi:hypothetical protein